MGDTMKPTSILKKYFGLGEGQDNAAFITEMKALWGVDANGKKLDTPSDEYIELVKLAAEELGVTPDFS